MIFDTDVSQFRTPHLMMLSGLGPVSILESFKIPVIANIPGVGQNMWVSHTAVATHFGGH